MYPVSDAFLEEIAKNTRRFRWAGTITTTAGRTYEFTNKDIVSGSAYVSRQCCGSSEIELGSVYAAEMGITLYSDIDRYTLDDAEITLSFFLSLPDGTEEEVPMGIFIVSEADRNVNTVAITAYDRMLLLEKDLSLNASSGTAYEYIHMACSVCGLVMEQSKAEVEAMPNGKEVLGVYEDNDMETYRDLVYYAAQVIGCVCQINRSGRLELIPYGGEPVLDVGWEQRFESTYSDFVTRYTGLSIVHLSNEKTKYYATDTDDGLTMSLGSNPLIQLGTAATRKTIAENILGAISAVSYVPFDSKTIGNPALDPMDVIRLSGGHADAEQCSCITSVKYNVNGKQELKCVGKNPRLASAKSKTDKEISGLLSQAESDKTVVYNFINATEFKVGTNRTQVLKITFTATEDTSAMFLAEVLLSAENDDGGVSVLTVTYYMNDVELSTFSPRQSLIEGEHTLTLFLPVPDVAENSANSLAMSLSMAGGTAMIGEGQIRATISGQGLVAEQGEWDGTVSASDTLPAVTVADPPSVSVAALAAEADVSSMGETVKPSTQTVGEISIGDAAVSVGNLADGLGVNASD